MELIANLLSFLSLASSESRCHLFLFDEPEMPKSLIER